MDKIACERDAELDVFELLQQDHRTLMALFAQLEQADDPGGAARLDLVMQIRDEFMAHAAAEEQHVYPLLEDGLADHLRHERAEAEHHSARTLLNELLQLPVTDPHFPAQARLLLDLLRHHVEEEEGELFPILRQRVDRARALGLAEQVRHFKRQFALAGSGRLAA